MTSSCISKLTVIVTIILGVFSAQANDIAFDNALMPRIIIHYIFKCQEQGLPVSEPIQRYCAQFQAGEICISEDDKACIAQELLEHFDMVQTYLQRVYKTWIAAGEIPEQYRALTRAAGCDTASVLALIGNISSVLATCCAGYTTDFLGTWTALGALKTDITLCCSTQQANFVSTWTIINSLSPVSSACGPVTVIRQSDIDAGNYTITTSGNYCLAEDIAYNFSGVIITIGVSNVFLDMHNHEIQSTVGGASIQIEANIDDITVTNGTFTNGNVGIQLLGSNSNITIEKCLFQNQTVNSVLADAGTNHIIAYCVFRNAAEGIAYGNINSLTIHDCIICNNTGIGVSISSGSNFIIQNCIVEQAGAGVGTINAITISNVLNMVCNNCIIAEASSDGINLTNCPSSNIQSCLVSNVAAVGIHIPSGGFQGSSDYTIAECYMYQNNVGIGLQRTSYAAINNCVISQNSFGLQFDTISHDITRNTFLMKNTLGIEFISSNDVTIHENTFLNNLNGSFLMLSGARNLSIDSCILNTKLSINSGANIIVRNNEAFSYATTAFVNTGTSNVFYNNNAFNAGSPAYSLSITNTFNVNTPDPLTGTVGDILRNLTNTN